MPPELGAQSLKRWTISEGVSCSVMSKQLHADSMDCIACQAPLSMEFSRQEYWTGLPFPSPGYLPDPGMDPRSPSLQADTLDNLSHQQSPWTTREIPYFFPIKFYLTSHFAQSQSDSKIKRFPCALV